MTAVAGQIWCDDCYYFDSVTGECKRKFVLVLAVDLNSGDLVTAVFTSKSHGLVEEPACFLGPPRAGYYVGIPGHSLSLESWVEFSSVDTLDVEDLAIHVTSGRKRLIGQRLEDSLFCAVLRCVLQSPDITRRQSRWVADTAAALGCA
ncbi:hypothetical protein [Pseudomonas bohemica]|uniref:hypothetical protein n=1 Tax=Pseudomonas bohemica TaxID=2044872 RepID=UPI0018FEBE3B|nr:hypothetical protein [Pseudomonas bohemica]